jgi:hypothetical protein
MKIVSTLVVLVALIAVVMASYNKSSAHSSTVYSESDSSEPTSSEIAHSASNYSTPAHYASEEDVSNKLKIFTLKEKLNFLFDSHIFRQFKRMKRKKMKFRQGTTVNLKTPNTSPSWDTLQSPLSRTSPLRSMKLHQFTPHRMPRFQQPPSHPSPFLFTEPRLFYLTGFVQNILSPFSRREEIPKYNKYESKPNLFVYPKRLLLKRFHNLK